MPLCRSCGAKIEWRKLKSGKNMPVDPDVIKYEDCEEGDVLVTLGGLVIKVDHSKGYEYEGNISHFATCPQADNWRKKNE